MFLSDVLMLDSLIFHFNTAQSVTELIKVIINKSKHLHDGAEQQDVTVHVQLQLFTVVLHWNNAGQRHAKPSTDILHLDHNEQYKRIQTRVGRTWTASIIFEKL